MTKIKLSPGLIPAIAKGDMDAFEQLYRQTYHVLYALALSWSGDHEVTLDFLQDTYIHIYNSEEMSPSSVGGGNLPDSGGVTISF